ncbi:caspase domain-containing protein [Streptomyces sp. NPDC088788]|uniref:caspase family protein n=1 Tax=Streptomyces sp. NPDC088788 TaxID=3365898 RepID=UPI003821EE51
MCVVQVLACRARGLDDSGECDRFDRLWALADEELVLDPLTTEDDRAAPAQAAVPVPSPLVTGSRPAPLANARSASNLLPDPDKSRAVLFGVGTYTHLEALPGVPAGLRDLGTALTAPTGAFSPEHAQVMVDPGSATEILDVVKEASDTAEDTLLLYFSGHGLIDSHSGDLSLALPESRYEAEYTSLQYNWIRRAVIESPARRKLVILDCCYSGRAAGVMGGGNDPLPLIAIEGTALITATSESRMALAPTGEPYTVFTGELIDLLRRGVADGPQVLDIDLIFNELRRRSVAKARPMPQMQHRGSMGRLPLAINPQYRAEPPS